MSASFKDFDDLVMSLNPAVYMPLCLGDIARRDGHSVVLPTVNGAGLVWSRTKNHKFGVGNRRVSDSGRLTLAAANVAETNVTAFTLFVAGKFRSPTNIGNALQFLVLKRDVINGNKWSFFLYQSGGINYIRFGDQGGAIMRTRATAEDHDSFAVIVLDGATVDFYADGLFLGGNLAIADTTAESADFQSASRHDGLNPLIGGTLSLVLHFPTLLTPQNISDLDAAWRKVRLGTPTWWKNPPQQDPAGPLIHWAGARRTL